jgi:hypothetical protein
MAYEQRDHGGTGGGAGPAGAAAEGGGYVRGRGRRES